MVASGRFGGVGQRLAWAVVLIAISATLLGLAWFFSASPILDGLDKLFGVIGALAGLVAVYLAVEQRRRAGAPANEDPGALDGLATAVTAVWRPQQRNRRLLNPHPLPTAWTTIGPPIADHWSNIRSDGDPTPLDLDGCLDMRHPDGLHQILTDRRLRGRVVILGDPGAGKTALLLREALRLLQVREPGDRVPVLLRLSTWNPDELHLEQWIASRLGCDYACATPIALDRLLPLLDGLDEMPAPNRARALQAISNTFDPEHPLVLTSRSNEYLDTLAALPGTTMAAATVLELTAVPVEVVRDYLQRSTGRANQWRQVFDRDTTDHDGRLAAALTEPLWIDLARTTYADPNQPDNQPAQLLDLPNTETIRSHLLDRLIPTAYPDPPEPGPDGHIWRRSDAHRYLRHLARHMQRHNTQDLAWWELARTLPRRARLAYGVAFGTALGLPFGLATGKQVGLVAGPASGLQVGLAVGLAVGLVFGLVFGLTLGRSSWRVGPSRRRIRWRRSDRPVIRRLKSVLMVGLGACLVVGLAVGPFVGLRLELLGGMASGLVFGLLAGLVGEFTTFLDGSDADLVATDPLGLLRHDRRRGLVTALWVGLPLGLALGLPLGHAGGPEVGLAGGLGAALGHGLTTTSWGLLQCARLWWCSRNNLPWPLMAFLADAHRRGLLRQAGGVYQFRHALLRDRLAT
jgi:hypothetical protein